MKSGREWIGCGFFNGYWEYLYFFAIWIENKRWFRNGVVIDFWVMDSTIWKI